MRNDCYELLLKLVTGVVEQLVLRGILFCHSDIVTFLYGF
jgi:hypothetical protein